MEMIEETFIHKIKVLIELTKEKNLTKETLDEYARAHEDVMSEINEMNLNCAQYLELFQRIEDSELLTEEIMEELLERRDSICKSKLEISYAEQKAEIQEIEESLIATLNQCLSDERIKENDLALFNQLRQHVTQLIQFANELLNEKL